MAKDGIGRPRDVTCEDVVSAFDDVDKLVATGALLAEMLDVSKQSVLRRLQELEEEGRVKRWKVGSRAVVWWSTEESQRGNHGESVACGLALCAYRLHP